MKKLLLGWIIMLLFTGNFISCKKEVSSDQVQNKNPFAVAGADQVINFPTDSISLDGSNSSDPDGSINEWLWTKLSGPASFMIVNPTNDKTVVRNLAVGTYEFQLKVIDNRGGSSRDTIMVRVNNASSSNHSPVANAGVDQTITLPTNSINLDGSGSTDPDNNIASYQWTKILGPSSYIIINAGSTQTQVSDLVQGIYQFELKVSDAGGLFDRDTVQVMVDPAPSLAIQWQKTFGGTRADIAREVQPTADGGFIIAGNTNSQDGDVSGYHFGVYGCYLPCTGPTICGYYPDGLVVKLNSAGSIQWQMALGGTAAENLLSIQPTPDGGYIASGLTYSNDGDVSGYHGGTEADAWVVKLNSLGTIQWQKVIGGSTGCDFANAILPTADGGYIFAGHTDSHDGDVSSTAGERDVWIVKLNSNGVIQWQKTIGGAKNDYVYSLQSTNDGGYVLGGYSFSNDGAITGNHGDADALIIKLNNNGNVEWQKSLGGSNEDIARSVQPTPDGGYIVAGSTKSSNGDVTSNHGDADAWIVKLSSSGGIQWQKALGGISEDIARSIQLTADGGYILAGSTFSNNGDVNTNHGGQDAWVVKLNSSGAIQWQKPFGGTFNEFINSIQLTADGNYIVAGQAISNNGDVTGNHGDTDAWIVKLKQ